LIPVAMICQLVFADEGSEFVLGAVASQYEPASKTASFWL
jgi:hypothetical protein